MRRTYSEPATDVRITGEVVPMRGKRFFAVRDGRHWYGNQHGVETYEGDPPSDGTDAQVAAAFAAFARALRGAFAVEDLSPESQQALEALGYTR